MEENRIRTVTKREFEMIFKSVIEAQAAKRKYTQRTSPDSNLSQILRDLREGSTERASHTSKRDFSVHELDAMQSVVRR